MDYVRREIEERHLVEEVIDPGFIEGFGNVKENRAGEPFFAKIHGYSFNEAGHLQVRAMSRFLTQIARLASVRVRLLHVKS